MSQIVDTTAETLTAKIVTMVCLFSISMAVGVIPMLISLKYNWFTNTGDGDLRSSNRLVKALLAFGGGVLFSTTFMHLLHEVDENIAVLQEDGDFPDLPVYIAGLIMSSGFFMMYLIEELVHLYVNNRNKRTSKDITRSFSIRMPGADGSQSARAMENGNAKAHSEHSHMVSADGSEDFIMTALRGLLIVLALSIHELFEGLAIGLEASVANVWYMFAAVSAHKYIIAFCVGVELLAARTKSWLSGIYLFTFSFTSAFGIGIGILMVGGAGATAAGVYSVVLQGLATGTLLYVVFFEVWKQNGAGLYQFFYGFLGYVVMTTMGFIVDFAIEVD